MTDASACASDRFEASRPLRLPRKASPCLQVWVSAYSIQGKWAIFKLSKKKRARSEFRVSEREGGCCYDLSAQRQWLSVACTRERFWQPHQTSSEWREG